MQWDGRTNGSHAMTQLEKSILILGLLLAACQPDSSTTEPEDGAYTPILIPQRIILTPVDGAAADGTVQPITLMGRAGAAQNADGTPLFPGEVRVFSPREEAVAGTASAGSFGALVDADNGTETIELVARDPATGALSEPVRVTVPRLGPDSPSVLPEYDPDTGKGVFVDPDPDHADRMIVEGRGGSADAGAEILITNLDNGEMTTATADGDGNFSTSIRADSNDRIVIVQTKEDKPGPPLVLPAPPRQCPDERMQVLFGKCRLVSSAQPDLIEVPGTAVNPFAIDDTNGIAFVSPVYLLTVDGDYQFVKPFDMDLNWAGDLPLAELQDYVRLYFAPRNANDNRWHERAGVEMGFTRRRVSTEASQLGFFRVGIAVEHLCANHFERNLDPLCFNNTGPGNSPNACAWLAMVLEQCDLQACGDGFLNLPDEECDDHNTTDGDGCSANCEAEGCGDGVVQAETGETCDDANEINTDACPNGCREARCGDGVVWQGVETCDDGVLNGQPGRCAAGCAGMVAAVCGNRVLEGGEQCDDGNSTGGDGCNANCAIEACGNGVLDQGEGCDDGNTVGGDGCAPHCRNERCGDGTQQPGEQCDDNNKNPGDGCDENCLTEACGNGIVQAGEACDDGDVDESDACLNDCRWNLCGDGKLYTGIEVCDGGSIACNDGCYDGVQNCYTDCTGYAPCDPLPQRCGNGSVEGCELCDDGPQNGAQNACDLDCQGDCPSTSIISDFIVDQSNQFWVNTPNGTHMARDPNGNLWLGGSFNHAANFGLNPSDWINVERLYLAKFDSNGKPLWVRYFGQERNTSLDALVTDSKGNVWITGNFGGTNGVIINFGGATFTTPTGGWTTYLAKFDSQGRHLFSTSFGLGHGYDLAVDSQDNVWVTGDCHGNVDFGGGEWVTANDDIFLVKYSPTGMLRFAAIYGDDYPELQTGVSLALDSSDNVWLLGNYEGSVNFGGGPLTHIGDSNTLLAKFDSDGNHLFSTQFGNAGNDAWGDIAVDGDQNVWLAGGFEKSLTIGGLTLSSGGQHDVSLAKFTPTGENLLFQRFGGVGEEEADGIVFNPPDRIWVYGHYANWENSLPSLNFGSGTLPPDGHTDKTFLALFDTDGNHMWSKGFVGSSTGESVSITSLVADGSQSAWISGVFRETVDLGAGPMTARIDPGPDASVMTEDSSGIKNLFLARLKPVEKGADVAVPGCYLCGDGIRDPSEACDDGVANGQPNDCNAECTGTTPPICGNGAVETGETCDDGPGGACLDDCSGFNVCGDGMSFGPEACDDHNTNACDGCFADCSRPDHVCGDGIMECGESCELGGWSPPQTGNFLRLGGKTMDTMDGRLFRGDGKLYISPLPLDQGSVSYDVPDRIEDIKVVNGRAYLADGFSGLLVLDVRWATPQLIGSYDTAKQALAVDVDAPANRAYVAASSQGILVFDIGSATPALIGSYAPAGFYAHDVEASGNRVYVAAGEDGLVVLDVSVLPPREIGRYAMDASRVILHDSRAYVVGSPGLQILDISAAQPKLVHAFYDDVRDVKVAGQRIYLADSEGLRILDNSGAVPVTIALHPISNYVDAVALWGNTAYVSSHNYTYSYMRAVDITEPCGAGCTPPACGDGVVNAGEACDDGNNSDCDGCASDCQRLDDICGDYVAECGEVCDDGPYPPCLADCSGNYVCGDGQVVDFEACDDGNTADCDGCSGDCLREDNLCGDGITECGEICDQGGWEPYETGSLGDYGTYSEAFIENGRIYSAAGGKGMYVADVDSDGWATLVGKYDTPGTALDVKVAGDRAYVADGVAGLQIFDLSLPVPAIIANVPTDGSAQAVFLSGNRAYQADGWAGLKVIDIGAFPPVVIGATDTPGDAEDVYVVGNRAYVADHAAGLQVFDVTGNSPVLVGNYVTPGNARSVVVSGQRAYVADGYFGLLVLDIRQDTPALVGSYSYGSGQRAWDVYVSGRRAYLANDEYGLLVLDISTDSPALVARYNTPALARGVVVSGRFAFVSDRGSLRIMNIAEPYCSAICTNVTCGDAVVNANERCDDGNPYDGDNCDSICQTQSPVWIPDGTCCIANGGSGCEQYGIQQCVCALDAACCSSSWVASCVNLAVNNCNANCP